jgi:short-subunit dehydrogenase
MTGRAVSSGHGWAVVTGASSGIGREFALELARRGYAVIAVARRADRLEALAAEARTSGGHIEPLAADLTTGEGIQTVVERAEGCELELLVNNAGFATYGGFEGVDVDRHLALVELNVAAVVALTRGLLPALVARGGGIVNVASQMGFQPMPYWATYAASKAFVLSFSEALAEELRDRGVRVTAVAPGFVGTEFGSVAGTSGSVGRLPQLEPRRVVKAALRANARGRVVTVVGGTYRVLTVTGRLLPRAAMRRLMATTMRPRESPAAAPARESR